MSTPKRDQWGAFRYLAACEDCSWRIESRNGQATGALHHDRTGHTVNVEARGTLTYCGADESARRRAWAGRELPRWLAEARWRPVAESPAAAPRNAPRRGRRAYSGVG